MRTFKAVYKKVVSFLLCLLIAISCIYPVMALDTPDGGGEGGVSGEEGSPPVEVLATESYITNITAISANNEDNSETNPLTITETDGKLSGTLKLLVIFELPDGENPSDNKIVIDFPDRLLIGSGYKLDLKDTQHKKIGEVSETNSGKKLQILFTDEEYLKESNRKGGFTVSPVTFTPAQPQSSPENFAFGSGENTVPLAIYYTPLLIGPTITKKSEGAGLSDGSNGYKWTVSLIPGNKEAGAVTLTDSLTDLTVDTAKGVTFDSKTLTEGAYTYEEATKPTDINEKWKNTLSYTTPELNTLDPFTSYEFVYYTAVNGDVFARTGEQTLSSKSKLFDTNTPPNVLAKAEGEGTEVKLTPKFITKGYEQKTDENGRKYLLWTVKINQNAINMNNAEFYINSNLSNPSYLDAPINVKVDNDAEISASGGDTDWKTGISLIDSFNYAMSNGKVTTIDKNPSISKEQTITFETNIKNEFFQGNHPNYTFDVGVKLKWWYRTISGGSGGISGDINGGWDDELGKPIVPNSLVNKTFEEYSEAEGIITWKIVVNENQNNLGDVTLTDTLQAGHTLVGAWYDAVGGSVITTTPASDNKFTIDLGNVGTSVKTIFLQTRPTPAESYKNSSFKVSNTASVAGTGIGADVKSTASKDLPSQILSKKAIGFDRATREIEWELTVNASKKPMTVAVITDTVLIDEVGHKLIDLTVTGGENGNTYSFAKVAGDDTKFTLDLGGDANGKTLKLKYKTTVTDDDAFNDAGVTKTVHNNAYMAYQGRGGYSGAANAAAERAISIDVVKKQMFADEKASALNDKTATEVSSYVKNTIEVNREYLPLADAVITDVMTVTPTTTTGQTDIGGAVTPFTIDPTSMELLGYSRDNTNEEIPIKLIIDDEPADFGEAKLSEFDSKGGFKITLPSGTEYHYKLTYLAKATDRPSGQYLVTNEVDYSNNSKPSKTAAKGLISFIRGGASGDSVGSITVVNKDSDVAYPNARAVGTVYELYDAEFGLLVDERTTGTDGTVEFVNLNRDKDYYLKEKLPGLGYEAKKLTSEEHEDKQKITVDAEKVSVDILSDIIMTELPRLKKTNEGTNENALPVIFTLKNGVEEIQAVTVTPEGDGVFVAFDELIRFSSSGYTLEETAADGFKSAKLEILMSDNRANGYEDPYDKTTVTLKSAFDDLSGDEISGYLLENKRLQGKLTITVVDGKDNNTKLAGAELLLGTESLTAPGASKTTDTNGEAVFDDVRYGLEYTVTAEEFMVGTKRYLPRREDMSGVPVLTTLSPNQSHTIHADELLPATAKIVVYSNDRNTNAPLSGSRFRLSSRPAALPPTSPMKIVEEKNTDATGRVEFNRLMAETVYSVEQVSAPDGYPIDTKVTEIITTNEAKQEYESKFTAAKPSNGNGFIGGGGNGSYGGGNVEPEPEPEAPIKAPANPWDALIKQLQTAKPGDTITLEASPSNEFPKEFIEALKGKDVTLVIHFGDKLITLNGKRLPKLDKQNSLYNYEELSGLEKNSSSPVPKTGVEDEGVSSRLALVIMLAGIFALFHVLIKGKRHTEI